MVDRDTVNAWTGDNLGFKLSDNGYLKLQWLWEGTTEEMLQEAVSAVVWQLERGKIGGDRDTVRRYFIGTLRNIRDQWGNDFEEGAE